MPTGTPGLGEGGRDARRVVRCPGAYLHLGESGGLKVVPMPKDWLKHK